MQKEIRVRKANKVLRVSENEVAKYIANGYDIIDEQGGVVQASVPHDPNILKKAFVDNQATITQLKEEVRTLKAEIDSLKEKIKSMPKEAVTSTISVEIPQTIAQTSTRSRKKRSE